MHLRTKKGLWVFLFFILLCPLLQHNLGVITSNPVHGTYNRAKDVGVSWESWWDGSYQQAKSNYINDNCGFTADLVRVNNQLDYSLFNKIHFFDGVLGTHHCLWERGYINAYNGTDYMGYELVLEKLLKLKKIQDTLASLGKTLVLIDAPCKAFFYPEYIPDSLKEQKRNNNNLQTFLRIGDSLGINQVDFNGWFMQLKNNVHEVIYPLAGIHWSLYGADLAADSMVGYLEKKRRANMVHITWQKVERRLQARETDDDLGKLLNLVFPFCKEVYTYPELQYPGEDKKQKPKAIYIGDSFLWQWWYPGIYYHINSNWQIWYRFTNICNEKYPYGTDNPPRVADIDWIAQVKNADYIILMYTAKNLPVLGDGFVEKAYDYFYPRK